MRRGLPVFRVAALSLWTAALSSAAESGPVYAMFGSFEVLGDGPHVRDAGVGLFNCFDKFDKRSNAGNLPPHLRSVEGRSFGRAHLERAPARQKSRPAGPLRHLRIRILMESGSRSRGDFPVGGGSQPAAGGGRVPPPEVRVISVPPCTGNRSP